MNKKSWIITIVITLALTGGIARWVFKLPLGEIIIDYFSFFAGLFLVTEGAWKILTEKRPLLYNQVLRTVRVIIGMCIFTIHVLQFMRY